MMRQTKPGVYQSTLLSQLPVVHSFSGRLFGDQREVVSKKNFLKNIGLEYSGLVRIIQVHGDTILRVTALHNGTTTDGYDGMVYTYNTNDEYLPILGITHADCAPVLLVDPEEKIIGAVHSGWKGSLTGITGKMISEMIELGSNPKNIYAAIGPTIRGCCYTVDKSRAEKFIQAFGPGVDIQYTEGKWRLDLPGIIKSEMIRYAIQPKHIDVFDLCTSCLSEEFFSYRADAGKTSGMNLSVISFLKI